MSSIIRLLPDHVANQIAAGEVVQRPASVVKELLENAVDAGATQIQLIVKDAGKTLIQVVDNGKGMNETDARMCFERHATSKISKAEDLFQLHTKGFRGEALASIAAVAHVELNTKTPDDELGTKLIIEGSKVIAQEDAVLPNGSSFYVKNLFFNIPARRNFLKSDQIEMRHIVDEFERVALPHPHIQFSLIHNGTEIFHLPVSNLRQRIVNIFGNKSNEKLVPVTEETAMVKISGFIGKPEFAKKTKGEQFFFVNHRYIRNAYLHHAVQSAYEGLLKDGMHPSYFLFFDIDPSTIDINIHPTKTEIKFEDEKSLYAIIRATVKHSLGQYHIAPALDFQRDPNLDTPYDLEGTASQAPLIEINTAYNPFENATSSPKNKPSFGHSFIPKKSKIDMPWETFYEGISNDVNGTKEVEHWFSNDIKPDELFEQEEVSSHTQRGFQLHKKYIVSSTKSGLLIIDQRRAHQKILFHEYLEKLNKNYGNSQQLLFPLQLFWGKNEMDIFHTIVDDMHHLGFDFEAIDKDSVTIKGIPVGISESEVSMLFEDIFNQFSENLPTERTILLEKIAQSFAQSLAIKSGTFLSHAEQENIVNSLFACPEPHLSPFGKLVYIVQDTHEIDKKFM